MNKNLHIILSFLLGIFILFAYAWWSGWPAPILSVDVEQVRVNEALPLPTEGVVIRQGFVARYDGLRQIEVLPAKFQGERPDGELIFRLLDDTEEVVAEKRVDTRRFTHNQAWKWDIARQDASAGREYALEVTSDKEVPFSLWGYTLDLLPGELLITGRQSNVRELRLVTRYELGVGAALRQVAEMMQRDGGLFVLALALMLMPGCLLLRLTHRWAGKWDIVAWWGCALALGLSLWPLIWYWMTLFGFKWSPLGLWVTLLWGWEVVLALWVWQHRQGLMNWWSLRPFDTSTGSAHRKLRAPQAQGKPSQPSSSKVGSTPPEPVEEVGGKAGRHARGGRFGHRFHIEHGLLLLIVLVGLAVRLLAVREFAFPLWVDSVRHALITQVMASKGQVLFDYAPYLPMIDHFPYHFGYHTIPASLMMMSTRSLPLLMLSLGQLLNALMPLMVYAAAWLMSKRRDVGVVAAFLVAFPFIFPGYYATWGRFTQLTGMLIMCLLVAMTWRMLHGSKRERVYWWIVGLLAAGLFLVHLRVFIYYLPFPFVLWLYSYRKNQGKHTKWLAAAALLGGGLVAPRIWYLKPVSVGTVFKDQIAGYNAFPMGYLTAAWEQYFLGAAAVSLLIVLVGRIRRTQWSHLPLVLLLWVGMLFLLLGGEYVGLPESWVVNLNSMYITLFFPLALLLGISSIYLWRHRVLLRRIPDPYHPFLTAFLYGSCGALLGALLFFGIHKQITILNDKTILAHRDDLPALEWVAQNTPPSARFVVGSWLWLGGTWAGQDAGSWLVPLTGRYSSTPPADYIYNIPLHEEVSAFNEAAKEIEDWSDPAVAIWLKEQGMTHLFVGAKASTLTISLDPAELKANPAFVERYSQHGAFVFEIE